MDTIWNCAFGVDIDIQNNPNNDYFTKCESAFSNSWKMNLPSYFGVYFYEFKEIMIDVLVFLLKIIGKKPPAIWLLDKISYLVEKRSYEKVIFGS